MAEARPSLDASALSAHGGSSSSLYPSLKEGELSPSVDTGSSEPGASERKEELTFATNLWDGFEHVFQRLTRGRHDLKRFRGYLEARAKIEHMYADALSKACKLEDFTEPSSLSSCWKDARDAGACLSKQHQQFGVNATEVVAVLDKMIMDIKTQKSEAKKTHQALVKDTQLKAANHAKAKTVYYDTVKQAETATLNLAAGRSANLPDKNIAKLEARSKHMLKEVDLTHSAYQKAVEQLAEGQRTYDAKMAEILSNMEDWERQRLKMIQELMDRCTQQHDFLKSSLEHIAQFCHRGLDAIDINKDIQDFIQAHHTGNQPPPHITYIPCSSEIIKHALGPSDQKSVTSPPPLTSSSSFSANSQNTAGAAGGTEGAGEASATAGATGTAPGGPSLGTETRAESKSITNPAPVYACALYDFDSTEPDDLTFKAGTIIKLLSYPEGEDWWHGDIDGHVGMFPKTYVQFTDTPITPEVEGTAAVESVTSPVAGVTSPVAAAALSPSAPGGPAAGELTAGPAGGTEEDTAAAVTADSSYAGHTRAASKGGAAPKLLDAKCSALYDFEGQDDDELSFKQGDTLIITGELNGWFLGKNLAGDKVGIFPSNYVQLET